MYQKLNVLFLDQILHSGISITGSCVYLVNEVTLLGVNLDSKWSWQKYIDKIVGKDKKMVLLPYT